MSRSRTKIACTLILVALLAAGCGGDGGGSDRAQTVNAPSSQPAEPVEADGDRTLTEAQLQAALLTVPDLPTGYKAGTPSDDSDTSESTGSDDCDAKFKRLGEAASAEASFEGPRLGSLLEQSLESYEDEDVLQERFEEVVSVLNDCPSFTSTADDGTTMELSVGPLSFPNLGDETVALAITGKTAEFDIAMNVVLVRLGRNVMSIIEGGLTTDAAVLEQAARKGIEKLAAATG